MSATITQQKKSMSQIWKAGAVAAVVSAVANAILFVIGAALGGFPESVIIPNAGGPMTIMPVIVASIIGVLGATLVYLGLNQFTKNPNFLFRIVAIVVLVLSFASPFSIPGAPFAMILILELMHVVPAVAAIYWLTGNVKV
ncbi:MAG: DUF6069 family protein [Chloroflexota bacterium]